jgi:hypothetical protein
VEANVKNNNHLRSRLELLEGRAVPSVSPLTTSAPAYPNHLSLDGKLNGTWSNVPVVPDVGKMQTLQGSGDIEHLGHVDATGMLVPPGFVASGVTSGNITLTYKKGTITIHLVGAQSQPGFSPPASKYYFSIVGGTGIYSHAWGGGVAMLQEKPEHHPDEHSGEPHPDFIVAASFKLTLQAYK